MGSTRSQRSKKVRAIMAGGVVLGLGVAATLAAWNSSDFAAGTFGTGNMVLEGSTNATDFANHPESSPATLSFGIESLNLAPGESVTAPYAVRLSSDTTVDATVVLNTEVSSPNAGLSYTVTQSSTPDCANGTQTGWVGTRALATADGVQTSPLSLSQGADTAAGAPVNLCFTVSAGAQADLTPGQTTSVVWEFAATQADN
ncbi:SipW-dependent-type signal peptide-containing protein [Glutamicibacter endophyticus]|uniref:SipW-dependent-type signal peptide-containing protein n=1 Tax=Glutamicibacter endophyticus TaxID=1522174 RepID=UPI003AF13CF8